jgi:fatty acid desaturase
LTIWPYRHYRVYHWEHHRHTQDPARDPELYFPKPTSRAAYLLVLTGIPNAIRRVCDMLRLGVGIADRPWMVPSEHGPLVIEARRYLLGYLVVAAASALVGTPVVRLVWIAPWLVGQTFLRLYLLAEHTGCGSMRDCLENMRTTLSMALVRLFAWNMPYHAEHHAYPAIPIHAPPRLHARAGSRIEHVEPEYVAATITVNRYLFG